MLAVGRGGWWCVIVAPPLVPAPAEVLVPELRTASEHARLEMRSQHGRNSHQMGSVAIYDLQDLVMAALSGHFLIRLASSAHLDNQNASEKIQHVS